MAGLPRWPDGPFPQGSQFGDFLNVSSLGPVTGNFSYQTPEAFDRTVARMAADAAAGLQGATPSGFVAPKKKIKTTKVRPSKSRGLAQYASRLHPAAELQRAAIADWMARDAAAGRQTSYGAPIITNGGSIGFYESARTLRETAREPSAADLANMQKMPRPRMPRT